jgi:P pilus assembly chaperone PapD
MKAPRAFALAAALCASAWCAGAFSLEPMSTLLAPSGAGRVATFRIKNDGPDRVAIRLEVLARSLSEDGKEVDDPAGDLFAVFPSRLLIESGATAVAKVQWKGPQTLEAELPFRLLAEQVGIDSAPDTTSGIKMRFRYLASIYVGTGAFAAKLEAKAEPATGPSGEKGFQVELSNTGTRHVIDRDASLSIKGSGGQDIALSSEELGELSGTNFLPGASRRLFIPDERAEADESYDALLEYSSEY